MPLSAAERQRRCREKRKKNPEKYEEYRRKHLARYHATKKLVNDMTPKEHLLKKRQWKKKQQTRRQKLKALGAVMENTPPSSPALERGSPALAPDSPSLARGSPAAFGLYALARASPATARGSPALSRASSVLSRASSALSNASTPKQRGRKQIRRDRAKVSRENELLRQQIDKLNQKIHKYKKRLSRNKKREVIPKTDDTSKYNLLSNAVKTHYNKIKTHKERRVFQRILTDERISKSRTKNRLLRESLGISKLVKHRTVLPKSSKLQEKVKEFYLRDDVSRATAGKKETVTLHKKKEQKRFLLDSMKNLHKTFLKENEGIKCHYSFFAKYRPFYVVPASIDGRDTCNCKVHANMAFTAITLFKNKVIDKYDMNQIIMETVCSVDSLPCMKGTCPDCATKKVQYDLSNNEKTVDLMQWIRTTEVVEKSGKKFKVSKHGKEVEKMSIAVLIQKFEDQLKNFKSHVCNIKVQYKAYRQCIDNLSPTEIALHIDFSENYACKYFTEIQAHHFGGSRNQVTLHTVVMYAKSPEDEKKIVTSFCTVSSSTNHGPTAIWAHLDPIFNYIRTELPLVKTVHVFSDGPASQYKQKLNFYLMATRFFEVYRFESISWNFFESGHSKGAADGVGGCLKRKADSIVATGHDIPDVSAFFEALKDQTSIKLFLVDDDDITKVADTIPNGIVPLKGSMQVHQMFTQQPGILSHRCLSCFCEQFCSCFNVKTYRPLPENIIIAANPIPEPGIDSGNLPNNSEATSANLPQIMVTGDLQPDSEMTLANLPPDSLLDTNVGEEDHPLIDITNFNKAYRQRIFNAVYSPCTSSDDENEPLSLMKEARNYENVAGNSNDNQNISPNELHPFSIKYGTYLLVKVVSERKTEYTYLGVAQGGVDEDGDVRVMFFRHVGTSGKLFKLVESDVSDVMYTNLVKIVPTPKQIKRGKRFLYEFNEPIEVFEM